jgi:hypothetical protein
MRVLASSNVFGPHPLGFHLRKKMLVLEPASIKMLEVSANFFREFKSKIRG